MYPSKQHYPSASERPVTQKERIVATIAAISLAIAVSIFPLILVVLLPFVWFFIPLFVPWPPFRSRLVRALRDAYAKEAAARRVKSGVEVCDLPEFFPRGSKVEDAEKLLRREGFKLVSASSLDAQEAARWGVHGNRLHRYSRFTHVHPLGAFVWDIFLFSDANGTIDAVRARPCYDGV